MVGLADHHRSATVHISCCSFLSMTFKFPHTSKRRSNRLCIYSTSCFTWPYHSLVVWWKLFLLPSSTLDMRHTKVSLIPLQIRPTFSEFGMLRHPSVRTYLSFREPIVTKRRPREIAVSSTNSSIEDVWNPSSRHSTSGMPIRRYWCKRNHAISRTFCY